MNTRILKAFPLLVTMLLSACGGGGTATVTALAINSTTPSLGADNVLTNTVLSIFFNKAVDPTTLTSSTFTLNGASTVSGTIGYSSSTNTATFTPNAALKPGTVYTATLTTGIKDSGSTPLAAAYSSTFTTEAFIQRGSVGNNGSELTLTSTSPSLSSNGRYLAFRYGPEVGIGNIYLHDYVNATSVPITFAISNNGAPDGDCNFPSISADGNLIAYQSAAHNIVAGDTNVSTDIFVYNISSGSTTRVSVGAAGAEGNGHSRYPKISADGRYVAFESDATNLVSSDTNAATDIFVRDMQTGTTTRVSVNSSNVQGDLSSNLPSISGDGRYIAFESAAQNLVKATPAAQIYVRDTQSNTTILASDGLSGAAPNGASIKASISDDGRYVAFESSSTNIANQDTSAYTDIIVHNMTTGANQVASRSWDFQPANGNSTSASISADGRYVAFKSIANNLVQNDTNGTDDVFVFDLTYYTPKRVHLSAAAIQANAYVDNGISMSSDGRYVSFSSFADNLTSPDTNATYDVFRTLNAAP